MYFMLQEQAILLIHRKRVRKFSRSKKCLQRKMTLLPGRPYIYLGKVASGNRGY